MKVTEVFTGGYAPVYDELWIHHAHRLSTIRTAERIYVMQAGGWRSRAISRSCTRPRGRSANWCSGS